MRQFYATVHFLNDKKRSMTWMVGHHIVKKKPLSLFIEGNGYEFHLDRNYGMRFHDEEPTELEEIISYCYPSKAEKIGFTTNMFAMYDVMNKLFRHSLCVKVGDKDVVRGLLLNVF